MLFCRYSIIMLYCKLQEPFLIPRFSCDICFGLQFINVPEVAGSDRFVIEGK